MLSLLGVLSVVSLGFVFTSADLTNVTVDDQGIDPYTGTSIAYAPSMDSWSFGQTCLSCSAQPDPKQAHNGTWHDATFQGNDSVVPNATFHFTGMSQSWCALMALLTPV